MQHTNKINISNIVYTFYSFIVANLIMTTLAYADVMQAANQTSDTFLDILYGPVAKIAAGVCAILLFIRLIQKDLVAVGYLFAAAIILFKIQDIVKYFTGN